MTEAAQEFVRPLAFRSVTGRPVFTDMWALDEYVQHVQLGDVRSGLEMSISLYRQNP